MAGRIIDLIETVDVRIDKKMENYQDPILKQSMESITALGSLQLNMLYICLLLSTRNFNIAFHMFISLSIAALVVYSLKNFIKRKRPKNHVENIISQASFPSGHSAAVFSSATLLGYYFGSNYIFYSVAIAVAISRIYLEDHYLSDVLVGSSIGLVIANIILLI